MEAPNRKVNMVAHDRATALSIQLTLTHQALRERVRELRHQLLSGRPPASPTGTDLREHCASLCAALDRHHTGEDEGLFPALRREFPELAPTVDKLAEDHWLIAGILRRLGELTAGDADAAAVVGELDGLAAIMDSHFAFEERRISAAIDALPASRREIRAADWLVAGE
jgi:hemerythrin-like domain-containing protein